MSGDFRETGSFTPSVALSPNPNRTWLKRTTASPPMTPAAKQIAIRCITVELHSITFPSFSNMFVVIRNSFPLPAAEMSAAIYVQDMTGNRRGTGQVHHRILHLLDGLSPTH